MKEESFFSENAADECHGMRKGAIGKTNGNVTRNISAKERAVCDNPKQEKTSRCVAGVITATEELVQHLKALGSARARFSMIPFVPGLSSITHNRFVMSELKHTLKLTRLI